MNEEIHIAKTVSIRAAGLDEYWLQEQIATSPSILGLGDLSLLSKERQQNTGGRLDILLKDPQDDSMYEVEVMLGETDETHIIRTIEYWDNEKRRWPQRQHYAVLVAEQVTRRFFNVIHMLSHVIPIIAIQTSLIEVNGQKSLFFTKVLDTYEEIDDGASTEEVESNRDYWSQKSSWTVEAADKILSATSSELDKPQLSYLKGYIAISVGRNNYFWLHKRGANKSLLGFRIAPHLAEEAQSILDSANISFTKKPRAILLTVDAATIATNAPTFAKISSLVRKTWGKNS